MICIYWPWCRILGSLLFNLDSPLTFARTAVIFCAVGTNSKSSEETPMVKLMDIDHKKERKVVACQNFIVMTSLSLYLHMSMTHLMTSNWMTCCRHRRSITTFWMLLPEPHTLIMPYCVCAMPETRHLSKKTEGNTLSKMGIKDLDLSSSENEAGAHKWNSRKIYIKTRQ